MAHPLTMSSVLYGPISGCWEKTAAVILILIVAFYAILRSGDSRSILSIISFGGSTHLITQVLDLRLPPRLCFLQGWEMFIGHSASADGTLLPECLNVSNDPHHAPVLGTIRSWQALARPTGPCEKIHYSFNSPLSCRCR